MFFNDEPTSIIKWIDKMFLHAKEKNWYETYWCIDMHGTISIPDYRKENKTIDFYPYSKECLKMLSDRYDIILILYTSSYPEEIDEYIKILKNNNIIFNYINENPEISEENGSFGYYYKKPYFNVLLDDKAGFDPYVDWYYLYKYLIETKYKPNKKFKKN